MPLFDLSIRTKLAIWAVLGVLLVAGMLAEQQIGDRSAARLRRLADSKQLTAVEALRAAKDLGTMRLELREMRLAIAPNDVDHALERLHADAAAAAKHIKTAIALSDAPADKAQLQRLDALTIDYVDVGGKLAVAVRNYGDTVAMVQRAGEIGSEMNELIEK